LRYCYDVDIFLYIQGKSGRACQCVVIVKAGCVRA